MRPASLTNAARPLALLLALAAASARGQEPDSPAEAAALTFVRENHPELADLLARLKEMKPDDYRKAVTELSVVAQNLGQLKQRDPRRYEAGLDVWKARSRVDLLAARLAGGPSPASGSDPELSSQLRAAVEAQLDAEIRQQKTEKAIVEERLKRLDDNLKRLESRRDAAVEARLKNLTSKGRRSPVGASAKTKAKAKAKAAGTAEPPADPAPKTDPVPNPKPGERQP